MRDVDPAGDGDFASPSGLVLVKIDPKTGGLVDSSCPDGIQELFIEGTEPTQSCDEIKPDVLASSTPEPFTPAKPAVAPLPKSVKPPSEEF
jgi:membrane carboxypeptidase/penicillin-binding protein